MDLHSFKYGPFLVVILGLALLLLVYNVGLQVPPALEQALIQFITAWILGQSAVDVVRAKNARSGADDATPPTT